MKHSEETKQKIRKSLLGKKYSDERKRNISIGHIGQVAWNKGKKLPQLSGENHFNWKGGTIDNGKGYLMTLYRNHKNSCKNGYVLTHRLIMEKHLKRILNKNEIVHHINGNKKDNRLNNLKIYNSNSKHLSESLKGHKNTPIKYKHYNSFPDINININTIVIKKITYIKNKCSICKSLFWTRKRNCNKRKITSTCSKKCFKIYMGEIKK